MPKEFKPTTPDYTLAAMNADGTKLGNVGAAWKTEDGRLRIKINADAPVVTLSSSLRLMLFPYEPKHPGVANSEPPKKRRNKKYEELVTLGSAYSDSEERVWTDDPTPNGPYDVG